MSRTATGAVLVSCLLAFLVGPELGFGPITSTSRADGSDTGGFGGVHGHGRSGVVKFDAGYGDSCEEGSGQIFRD